MAKRSFISIRILDEDKESLKEKAKKAGFNSLTAYILWLMRNKK